jgi:hypothetical protein
MNWISKLLTPTVTPRELPTKEVSPLNSLINKALIAEIISGSSSTLADKASFVAMPYVVDAVAKFAVYKENGESK